MIAPGKSLIDVKKSSIDLAISLIEPEKSSIDSLNSAIDSEPSSIAPGYSISSFFFAGNIKRPAAAGQPNYKRLKFGTR
ncbi:hypothetical protein [Bacillus sp. P14.5]|uniref:hypothetical protein n=1 Tax=Bacillus sp. P14.5 TaxID=1983400 RepID=UPI0013B0610A|nr:hypothetical protein [Bacillus sp. P14.5]